MNMMDEEDMLYHLGGGCLVHGDEFIRECTMCGAEFCGKCNPGAVVCVDCADGGTEEPFAEEEAEEELAEDEEVEDLLNEAEGIPEEDLIDDEFGEDGEEEDAR